MADKKISQLTAVSTPLAGTEVLPIVQSGSTKKVTALELTGVNVTADGRVGVGGVPDTTVNGSAITAKFGVHQDGGSTNYPVVGAVKYSDTTSTAGVTICGARGRGSKATPTVVSDGDLLSSHIAAGHDGTDFAISSRINYEVDGAPGNDDMPGRIVFLTAADGSQTPAEAMRISASKDVSCAGTGAFKVHVGTSAQRPAAPATGMIRHNTQYGCPEYYNGTFWVQMNMGEPNIGDPFGGGFFAGYISETADGVATHMLIVSPKASGETTAAWDTVGSATTGFTSLIDGPTNSAGLAALGSQYAAATFCEGLTINGYSDWYLPARNELEVAYYSLKNVTQNNYIAGGNKGNNVNAVPPWEPVSTDYTAARPAQTTVTAFKVGGVEAFADGSFWSSSEDSSTNAWSQGFVSGSPGDQYGSAKTSVRYVRAFRRLAI